MKNKLFAIKELLTRAASYFQEQLKASERAISYLKGRGVNGKVTRDFGIGYAPEGWNNLLDSMQDADRQLLVAAGLLVERSSRTYDRFRDRIMFPITDNAGAIIGFGGRAIGDELPKYLNSPESEVFIKGNELYGLYKASQAIEETRTVIVVEGYMDVVALHQHGITNCVGSLGTATTSRHVERLLQSADRMIFCFDGDNAGRLASERAIHNCLSHLPDDKYAGVVTLPQGMDPDSFVRQHGAEKFRDLLAGAASLDLMLIQHLKTNKDLATCEGRAHLVLDACHVLQRIAAPVRCSRISRAIAHAARLSLDEVREAYSHYIVNQNRRKYRHNGVPLHAK